MGVLFHPVKAQRNPAEVFCGHCVTLWITEYLTIIGRHMSTVHSRMGTHVPPLNFKFEALAIGKQDLRMLSVMPDVLSTVESDSRTLVFGPSDRPGFGLQNGRQSGSCSRNPPNFALLQSV